MVRETNENVFDNNINNKLRSELTAVLLFSIYYEKNLFFCFELWARVIYS